MAAEPEPYSILVVEDNPDIVIGLQDMLEHDGYEVTVAGGCAEALAQIHKRRFNVLLLDLGLPDGDGLDVLKEMQRLDSSVPVVILTAHISPERTVGSLVKGAFTYITKPYNREELRETIRRAIGIKELAVKVERAEHLLSESEDRFRSLVESATDAIIVADAQGVIVSCNRAASTLFDYQTEDMVGRPLTFLMPARYRQAHEQGLARMEAKGKSRVIGSVVELHGLRKDGTEFPFELSLATWKTSAGSFYSGIIRDISRRKQIEQALTQLERHHRLILTQAGEGIYGLDLNGCTTFVNFSAASMLGYRAEELLGRNMHEVLHHSRSDGSPYPVEHCPIYAAIHDGQIHRVSDEVFWRKDGTNFPVDYTSTPIREEAEVVGAVIVFRDITERLKADQALRRSEQLLRRLADNTTAVIYVKDPDGRFLFTNRRFEQLFHLTTAQIIGHTNHDIFPSPIADAFRANDLEVVKRNATVEYEEQAPHEDGLHTYLSIKFPLSDHTGAPYATCGISTDITQRKRMEQALQTHHAQLRLALKAVDVGTWNWDLLTGRLCWSWQVNRFFGVSEAASALTVNDWLALVHPEDRDQFAVALRRVKEQQDEHVLLDHRVLKQDGKTPRVVWTGQLVRDRRMKPVHVLGTMGAADERCEPEPNIYSPWSSM